MMLSRELVCSVCLGGNHVWSICNHLETISPFQRRWLPAVRAWWRFIQAKPCYRKIKMQLLLLELKPYRLVSSALTWRCVCYSRHFEEAQSASSHLQSTSPLISTFRCTYLRTHVQAFRYHSLLHLAKTLPDPLFVHDEVIIDEQNDNRPRTQPQPRENIWPHDKKVQLHVKNLNPVY